MSMISAKCDIRYNLNNRTSSIPKEFQRAIIELHEDNNKYVLRAVSSDRKTQIFKVNLDSKDVYQFGENGNADRISTGDGLCYLVKYCESSNDFNYALGTAIAMLESSILNRSTSGHEIPQRFGNENNILYNIRQLNDSILNGEKDEASKFAKNVAIQLNSYNKNMQIIQTENDQNEDPIQIQIQIDDLVGAGSKEPHKVTVYPSTTIDQLRAVFAAAFDLPLSKQCFFVNRHLAHGTSTMQDLNIENDAFFVLLLLPKDCN